MDKDQNNQMIFDWLRFEQDFTNDRIAAYSEADIKIVSLVSTVIVALIGLSPKFGLDNPTQFTYVLFLGSGLLSLAVIASVYYSALTMLFRKRKLVLITNMSSFLNVDPDFTDNEKSLFAHQHAHSYYYSIRAYVLFKSVAPLALLLAALITCDGKDWRVASAATIVVVLVLSSFFVTILHISDFIQFGNTTRTSISQRE